MLQSNCVRVVGAAGEGEIGSEQRVILAQKATTVGISYGFSFTLTNVYRAQFSVRIPWSSRAIRANIQRNRADFQQPISRCVLRASVGPIDLERFALR